MPNRSTALLLMALVLTTACRGPAEPERFSLIGSWASVDVRTGTAIRMTLTETAREVSGAGSWIDPENAIAFRIEGAHADRTVALVFDFPFGALGFQGRLRDQDTLEGTLTGSLLAETVRERPITFTRETAE